MLPATLLFASTVSKCAQPVAAVHNRRLLSYGAIQLPIASSPPFPSRPSE